MKKTEEKMENCVLCNQLTDIPVNRHIDFRENYIEGCGQLCHVYAKKI